MRVRPQSSALAALLLCALATRAAPAEDASAKAPLPSWLTVAVLPASYVNNQYATGVSALPEPLLGIDVTARVFGHPVIFEQTLWQTAFPFGGGYVNNIGPGRHYLPAGNVIEYSIEETIGAGVGRNWFVEAVQSYRASTGFPDTIGIGIAGEKIPDFRKRFSLFGKLVYFPKFVDEDRVFDTHRQPLPINYQAVTFSGGAQSRIGRSNGFITYGLQAEYFAKTVDAPASTTRLTPFAGYVLRVL